jgi:hypothetical protein
VGPRGGLDDVEKRKFLTLPGLELRPFGCPVHSQSLYRLSYPSSLISKIVTRCAVQCYSTASISLRSAPDDQGFLITYAHTGSDACPPSLLKAVAFPVFITVSAALQARIASCLSWLNLERQMDIDRNCADCRGGGGGQDLATAAFRG